MLNNQQDGKIKVKVFNITFDQIFKDFYGYQDPENVYVNAVDFFTSAFNIHNITGLEKIDNVRGNASYLYTVQQGVPDSAKEIKITDVAFRQQIDTYKKNAGLNTKEYKVYQIFHMESQRVGNNDMYYNIISRVFEYQNRMLYENTMKGSKASINSIIIANFTIDDQCPILAISQSIWKSQQGQLNVNYLGQQPSEILIIQLPNLKNVRQQDITYYWKGQLQKCSNEFYDWLQLLSAEHTGQLISDIYQIELYQNTRACQDIKQFFDGLEDTQFNKYVQLQNQQIYDEKIVIDLAGEKQKLEEQKQELIKNFIKFIIQQKDYNGAIKEIMTQFKIAQNEAAELYQCYTQNAEI